MSMVRPYAVVDNKGEAYVYWNECRHRGFQCSPMHGRTMPILPQKKMCNAVFIGRAVAAYGSVTGLLFVPKSDYSGMLRLKFNVPAKLASDKFAKAFYRQKSRHYQLLLNRRIPGGRWFRHEMRQSGSRVGTATPVTTPNPVPFQSRFGRGFSSVEDTFDLFSGGRAIAENLQLERATPAERPKSRPSMSRRSRESRSPRSIGRS